MDYTKTAIDLSSELDVDEAQEEQRKNRYDLATNEYKFGHKPKSKKAHHSNVISELDNEERIKQKAHLLTLDAYGRHKKYVNDYITYYGGKIEEFQRDKSKDKSLFDVVREEHKFIWKEDEKADTWAQRLAKRYYDKLFREYCIVDLRIYQTGKIGMRWRTRKEVISGKGQFVCGEKFCQSNINLCSWEVNFAYVENGEKERALVKARLCPECSEKLNFKRKHERQKREKRRGRRRDKKRPRPAGSSGSTGNDTSSSVEGENSLSPEIKEEAVGEEGGSGEAKAQPELGSSVWAQKVMPPAEASEKSRDQEFDQYFQDMFL